MGSSVGLTTSGGSMKRLIWLGCVVTITACGGGGGGKGATSGGGKGTTGGAMSAAALCGGECCASGDSCIGNACCPGPLSCGTTCCPSGGACIDGACCPSSQSCGTVCCPGPGADGGQEECVNNACCPVAQACKDICCASDSECIPDSAGNFACNKLCQVSMDCDPSTPCCELLDNGQGAFSGHGICTATPSPPSLYACLCTASSECSIFGNDPGDEWTPAVNTAGFISGPYVCTQNGTASGAAANQGCAGNLDCTGQDQFCATDTLGNKFCSDACQAGMDFQCGNPTIACCNNVCSDGTQGDMCCGLCPPSGGGT
jgi:hypothetical protein